MAIDSRMHHLLLTSGKAMDGASTTSMPLSFKGAGHSHERDLGVMTSCSSLQ
jgi:hypothetical protein